MLTWILWYFWSLLSGVSPCLEWGHARALSSPAVAAVSRFLRVDKGIRGFPLRLCHEAFPRGFPTGMSHVPPWCESILGLKVEAVQGKLVSLEWTETSGGLWEWWHDPGFPLAFPVENASCSDARECQESFPDDTGRNQSSRAMRRKRGSSGCGRDSRVSSRVKTGMSGNFLSCSKGVKYPLELPEVRCD